MYLFASLTSVFAWERVYPHKFAAVFRSGLRHSVQAQNPSVQSTAENQSCTVSLPEQKPASNFPSHLYPCLKVKITLLAHIESTWLHSCLQNNSALCLRLAAWEDDGK